MGGMVGAVGAVGGVRSVGSLNQQNKKKGDIAAAFFRFIAGPDLSGTGRRLFLLEE